MIFTIVGILAILLLGVGGWMRGALRILASFGALLVAGFLAALHVDELLNQVQQQ